MTFGGGIAMTNDGRASSGSAAYKPSVSHVFCQRASTAAGSYRGSIARESRERRSAASRCGAAPLPGTARFLSSRGASGESSESVKPIRPRADESRNDDGNAAPAWDRTLHGLIAATSATDGRLCVAVIDLDRFKDYNDRHGHQAGDRLLKSAAAGWRTALRQTDSVARYGGEEFVVSLHGCSLDEAEAVLERLRSLTPEGQTCSVGVASWDGVESDAALVARADAALYEAKRRGRDTLVAA